jgi:hypothetical protein
MHSQFHVVLTAWWLTAHPLVYISTPTTQKISPVNICFMLFSYSINQLLLTLWMSMCLYNKFGLFHFSCHCACPQDSHLSLCLSSGSISGRSEMAVCNIWSTGNWRHFCVTHVIHHFSEIGKKRLIPRKNTRRVTFVKIIWETRQIFRPRKKRVFVHISFLFGAGTYYKIIRFNKKIKNLNLH